jgi:RNA polymerase sigma factor (sigma-70 family)
MKSEKIKDKSPEDVVQETWLLVHRKLHQYQIGTRFRAWVLRIAHNVFLGFKRGHRKSSAFPSDPADDTPPDARLNRQERANALYAAMLQLPIDQAQALYLAKVDRWTYKEIARHQDCSIHTVKKRLKHARDELRRLLGIDFDNDGELSLINTS